jgi:hypothetical protein
MYEIYFANQYFLWYYLHVTIINFLKGVYGMKIFKVLSTVFLLSSAILINYNNVQAHEAKQTMSTPVSHEEQSELVTFGTIGNNELRMEKNSLESLETHERQRLLSYAVKSIIRKDMNEAAYSQDKISLKATVGRKVVETKHSCSPTGPYLMDKYYRVAYVYNQNTGAVLEKIEFYICGDKGTNCNYLASITTSY